MRIQHNIMAMNAYRNYTNNVSAMKKNLEKLSSGYKINRAGDDAAGLAISEKMRAQITGLETAQKNAKDGISLVQTAEGALTEVHDMLNRMVELATQSANGTYDNDTDRYQMQKEVDQLLSEINRIADSSNFNGINLLDGTLGLNTEAFEVGDTTDYVAAEAAGTWNTAGKVINAHGGSVTTGGQPKFTVDLSNLAKAAWGTAGAAADATIKLKVGNATMTGVLATNTTTAGSASAAAIANAFATTSVAINGMNFKVEANAGKLTFTATKTASQISSTDVTNFKAIVGGGVEMATGARVAASYVTGQKLNYNHAVEDVEDAVKYESGGRLGVDINISTLIGDGNTLTIDGKTYTFHVGSTATTANTATKTDIYIDTNKYTTASAQRRQALVILSNKDTDNFDIETKNADSGVIHIDQNATSLAKATLTKDAMLKGITGTTKGAGEKIASTKLKVTESALKEGNVLTLDGNTKITVGKNETADTLAAKITAAGYKTTVANGAGSDAGKKILTIAGKLTDADGNDIDHEDVASPQILGKGLTLQIGDTSDDFNQLNVAVQDMHAISLGLDGLKINTEEQAQKNIQKIKDAINTVSDVRGTLGATQNRLDHTINNLSVMTENIQDAESTIRDTDVAEEMMAYTKNNILIQSAQAMLAQANQVPQGVLQLLQ